MDKSKIKKYKWILNKKDFKFIEEFCEKEHIIEGRKTKIKLSYFLNEYKLNKRKENEKE